MKLRFSKLSGQCGFPGQPWRGFIWLNNQIVKEINWKDFDHSVNDKISYLCDDNHLPIQRQEFANNRTCINGKWNGSIPICGINIFVF